MKLNCIIIEDEKMSKLLLEKMINSNPNLNLIKSFEKPLEAVSFLAINTVDLIFLDVEMPELNGFEVLDSLNNIPNVILTTSKKEYAFQGFEYKVKAFLLKPFTLPKFSKAVNQVLGEYSEHKTTNSLLDSIFIKTERAYKKINFENILYIEAYGDFVKIHTKDSREVTRSTMKEIEGSLPTELFLRIHRSFIINLTVISSIEDHSVIINEAILPIGNIYRVNFYNKINMLKS